MSQAFQDCLNSFAGTGGKIPNWDEPIDCPVEFPAGVKLMGGELNVVSSVDELITLNDDSGFEGVTINANGLVTNRISQAIGVDNTCIVGNHVNGAGNADIFFHQNTERAEVRNNETYQGWNAVLFRGKVIDPDIVDNEIRLWRQRGIYVVAEFGEGTEYVLVKGNEVYPHLVEDRVSPKQPIAFQVADNTVHFHKHVKIIDNDVYGIEDFPTGAGQNGNTSDQISLINGLHLKVCDNYVGFGGEGGIVVHGQSRHGLVSGNIVHRNDLFGLSIGNITGGRVSDISVFGNHCTDNGQIIDNDVPLTNSANLWIDHADRITMKNNTAADTGVGYSRYGLRIRNSTGIDHDNCYYGNTVSDILID